MNWLTMFGLLARTALAVGGGALATQGVTITDDDVDTVIGGVAAIGAVGWSIYQKKKSGALEK